jgi:cell division protein ZapA
VANLKNVALEIGGKTYPLRVDPAQEADLLTAAESVNRRLREYEKAFGLRDVRDLLAMCALQFSAEHIRIQRDSSGNTDSLQRELDELLELAASFRSE